MILKGSQRGGGIQLAQHLMNTLDNDHIALHDIRGFVADDLAGAFKEIEAISKGTRCRQYLFSLSLNPPELENAPPELFETAIDNIETKLGLIGQPRAVIFHEKNGRRHAHCVWSRIDAGKMRSINLPHFKMKLQDIARDLFLEHQWQMPAGFKNKLDRDPLNYGSVESEQAKRAKRDPKRIKAIFRRCWEQSDSKQSFAQALTQQGYILAKGDRRGFVAVDRSGEIYSASRWVGVKTKELRERLGVTDGLPSVKEALQEFEARTNDKITQGAEQQNDKLREDMLAFTGKRLALVNKQRNERLALTRNQAGHFKNLSSAPDHSSAGGLKALWHRFSGFDAKQREQIKSQRAALIQKHAIETQQLIQDQLKERRRLQQSYHQLQHHHEFAVRNLWRNLDLTERSHSSDEADRTSTLCVCDPSQPLVLVEEQDPSLARRVRDNPPTILGVISRNKEDFSRNDIVRDLANYIDDPTELYLAIDNVFKSDELIETSTGSVKRYTTRELLDLKNQLHRDGLAMADAYHGKIDNRYIAAAIKFQNKKLQLAVGARLSAEQESSITHVLGSEQLSLVTGYAGAGKSTMLEAAAQAWKQNGYNVIGAALSGKAADGLEISSGIQSRTIASLEKSWEGGYRLLTKRDVLVIDEAGMVDLRQMARIVGEVKKRGAKLVLVGDAEQLQPIQAGTPFKEFEKIIGAAKLSEVRRQKQSWQRDASKLFAERQTQRALQCYHEQGCTRLSSTNEEAIASLVKDYMADVNLHGVNGSRLALAHRRKDVHLINQSIRSAYRQSGYLGDGVKVKTDHGPREFSVGDRVVLTKNDRDLEVRNGMLGTVTALDGNNLKLTLDGENSSSRTISVNSERYTSIDHGYATTIHKSQGATIDKSFVLASESMDRHLTYVAMTRHRASTQIYLDKVSPLRSNQPQQVEVALNNQKCRTL